MVLPIHAWGHTSQINDIVEKKVWKIFKFIGGPQFLFSPGGKQCQK